MHGRFCEGGMIEKWKAQASKFENNLKSIPEQPSVEAVYSDRDARSCYVG